MKLRYCAVAFRKTTVGRPITSPINTARMMASTLWLLVISLLVLVQLPTEQTLPQPQLQPRVLKRDRKKPDRTRLATLNCRTLLADELLDDLDDSLIKNNISICALQEVRRNGLLSTYTKNYKVYWFGECKVHRGVGSSVHKNDENLISAVRGLPELDYGHLLYDAKKPTILVCAYSPPNT